MRGQIRGLFLLESLLLGLTGSIVGIFFGLLMARGMAGYIGSYMGEIYGLAERTQEISTSSLTLVLALLLGMVTSMLAAWTCDVLFSRYPDGGPQLEENVRDILVAVPGIWTKKRAEEFLAPKTPCTPVQPSRPIVAISMPRALTRSSARRGSRLAVPPMSTSPPPGTLA